MIKKQLPRIERIAQKKLVGQSVKMSLANNKTVELFSHFMPQKKHINNALSTNVYEVMLYKDNHFQSFNPTNSFTKWATVEVSSFEDLPQNMETYVLDGGLYAVFAYKGLAKDFGQLMRYILMEWLPNSNYTIDTRAHFNLLCEKTKRNDPNSQEDVWIPIKTT